MTRTKYIIGSLAIVGATVAGFLLLNPEIDSETYEASNPEYKDGISPPLKGEDVEYSRYRIATDRETKLKLPTGTELIISPNSIIDKNGQVVKDSVDIKFREFHNAKDVFLSGIPMELGENRNSYMSSGGMFDLRIGKKEEELTIDPDIGMEVKLASFRVLDDDFELFFLEDDKAWDVREEGFVAETNITRDSLLESLKDPEKPKKPNGFKNREFQLAAHLHRAPHLKSFMGVKWVADRDVNKSKFISALRTEWDNVEIVSLNKTTGKTKISFEKTVFTVDGGSRVDKYSLIAYPKNLSNGGKADKEAYAALIAGYEKSLAMIREERERVALQAEVLNSIRITNPGVWNIDKIKKKDDMLFVEVTFDFEKEIDPLVNKIAVYVILHEDNSVLTFMPQDWKKVSLIKDRNCTLVAVLPRGEIAVVRKEDLNSIDLSGGVANFITNRYKNRDIHSLIS